MNAISSVFEAIAPGQSEKLKSVCLTTADTDPTVENLQHAVSIASGRNNKLQLVSILCMKNEQGIYNYTIADLLKLFQGTTKHDIEKAQKHAGIGKCGMPIEVGKCFRTQVMAMQINHFLDFMQFSGLVQDVASGTRSVKLSTVAKSIMPNVVCMVHKAEIIRLYEAACDEEGYNNNSGQP